MSEWLTWTKFEWPKRKWIVIVASVLENHRLMRQDFPPMTLITILMGIGFSSARGEAEPIKITLHVLAFSST
jgi:hypothetical protein